MGVSQKQKNPRVTSFLESISGELWNANVKCHCGNVAMRGYRGQERSSCTKHAKPDMVDLAENKRCCFKVCSAKTGKCFVMGSPRKMCAVHCDEVISRGQFPVEWAVKPKNTKFCTFVGCRTIASFDKGKHCKIHAVSVTSDDLRRCELCTVDTGKRPTFGYPGAKARMCFTHKLENMVSHKLCVFPGCSMSGSYGEKRDKCVTHKAEGDILHTRTCVVPECAKQPSFGVEGSGEYTHCSEHGKPLGLVDVKNAKCMSEGCSKNKSFGKMEDGIRMWCVDHKTDGDINLVETKCVMLCCEKKENASQVKYFHPEYNNKTSEFFGKRICCFGSRILVEDAIMSGDSVLVSKLKAHFGMDNVSTLNALTAFRIECEKYFFEHLDCCKIIFDDTVRSGDKFLGDKRPDIMYMWDIDTLKYAIHIEYDEEIGHEDEVGRIEWIHDLAGCTDRAYVIRVQGNHGTSTALCIKVPASDDYHYFEITENGKKVARKVADEVMKRIYWIKSGLAPDSAEGRPGIIRL